MGKTYYCDYCDRSFKDNVEARRKHLSSLQHVKNRMDHYNMFKDPETILMEERKKTPCKHYMTNGDCAFGFGCRFSHYTPPMMWELERLVAMKNSKDPAIQPKDGWPNPEDIIKEYFESEIDSNAGEKLDYPMLSAPSGVMEHSYLPPSLRPITSEGIANCNFNKWG